MVGFLLGLFILVGTYVFLVTEYRKEEKEDLEISLGKKEYTTKLLSVSLLRIFLGLTGIVVGVFLLFYCSNYFCGYIEDFSRAIKSIIENNKP